MYHIEALSVLILMTLKFFPVLRKNRFEICFKFELVKSGRLLNLGRYNSLFILDFSFSRVNKFLEILMLHFGNQKVKKEVLQKSFKIILNFFSDFLFFFVIFLQNLLSWLSVSLGVSTMT